MQRIVILEANKSEYDIRDAASRSMTVREFINELECNYNDNDKIVFSNDQGYTYGYVGAGYIDTMRVETHEEENLREKMEELQVELEDLKDEYENSDEDDEPMTLEEYRSQQEALFKQYGITEEQYANFKF